MDKNIVLAVIFGAAAVVGAMETVYQIYQLTVMDELVEELAKYLPGKQKKCFD